MVLFFCRYIRQRNEPSSIISEFNISTDQQSEFNYHLIMIIFEAITLNLLLIRVKCVYFCFIRGLMFVESIDTSELLQGLTNKKGLKQLKQRLVN